MTALLWDEVGERRFETGIDHGVLYPESGPGVPWNGLVSVDDKSEGDAPEEYWYDGVKYLGVPSPTDFSAQLEAITYPLEFEECDGTAEISDGYMVTQQLQKTFGLSYRTLIGNDIEGVDHGYKIHFVYNALAQPTDRPYETISDDANPANFVWDISTTPVEVPNYKPSAHYFIDSTRIPEAALLAIESILYGFTESPRLPLPTEIVSIIEDISTDTITEPISEPI